MEYIIKNFLGQPAKLRLLILYVAKFFLTGLIVSAFYELPTPDEILTDNPFNKWNDLILLINHALTFIISWFLVWNVGYVVFIGIMVFGRKNVVGNSIYNQTFPHILKKAKIYEITATGYEVPNKRIEVFFDLARELQEDKDLRLQDTLFAQILFVGIIYWIYSVTQFSFNWSSLGWLLILLILIVLGVILFRVFEDLFFAFKDNSSRIFNVLNTLAYRKKFMTVVLVSFEGKLHSTLPGYQISVDSIDFHIMDFYNGDAYVGNSILKKALKDSEQEDIPSSIIVSNFTPDQELSALLKSKNLAGFITANEESEMIQRLAMLLDLLAKK